MKNGKNKFLSLSIRGRKRLAYDVSICVACEPSTDESTVVKKTLPRNGLNFRFDLLRLENIFFRFGARNACNYQSKSGDYRKSRKSASTNQSTCISNGNPSVSVPLIIVLAS